MGDETMEHKVTFHIDENARRSLLLGNADNLLRAAADIHMTVEVPANGPAVPGYALKPASTDTAAAMADFVVPVPAGVIVIRNFTCSKSLSNSAN